MILIFATFNIKTIALKIGKALLKQRLIACYNLWSVESAYWWHAPSKSQHEPSTNSSVKTNAKIRPGKGKILDEKEILMILKTKESNFAKIESYIKKHSGYEVPEVVAIKADKVNQPYLDWIDKETK